MIIRNDNLVIKFIFDKDLTSKQAWGRLERITKDHYQITGAQKKKHKFLWASNIIKNTWIFALNLANYRLS